MTPERLHDEGRTPCGRCGSLDHTAATHPPLVFHTPCNKGNGPLANTCTLNRDHEPPCHFVPRTAP